MKEEEKLIENAEERLSTAKLLLENEKYGDAVSRAYYSMFNAAKAILLTKDSMPRTHQGVNSELGKLFRQEIDKELLREFSRIQQIREDVDYGTETSITREEAEEKINIAEDFLDQAQKILG